MNTKKNCVNEASTCTVVMCSLAAALFLTINLSVLGVAIQQFNKKTICFCLGISDAYNQKTSFHEDLHGLLLQYFQQGVIGLSSRYISKLLQLSSKKCVKHNTFAKKCSLFGKLLTNMVSLEFLYVGNYGYLQ